VIVEAREVRRAHGWQVGIMHLSLTGNHRDGEWLKDLDLGLLRARAAVGARAGRLFRLGAPKSVPTGLTTRLPGELLGRVVGAHG
jgi:hypothetical protein